MKHRPTRSLLGALALAAALTTATMMASAEEQLAISPAQRSALGIEVVDLEEASGIARPLLPGRILLPNDKSQLVSVTAAGVVVGLEVATGDVVEAGRVIARIESPHYVRLQRELLESLSKSTLARTTYERERQLSEEGIIAARRAESSLARLREAEALVDERRHALAIVGMDEDAIRSLERTRRLARVLAILAPLSGVVLEQHVQTGQRLDAGAPLYRIGEIDVLHVEIHVPIEIANEIPIGALITIPEHDARGRVVAIGREVHSLDQGVLVRGELESSGASLRPGQFVRVGVEVGSDMRRVFDVPATAVVHVGQETFVFREIDGGFEPVQVRVIGGSGDRLVITGSLEPTQRIVVHGTASLEASWLESGGPG